MDPSFLLWLYPVSLWLCGLLILQDHAYEGLEVMWLNSCASGIGYSCSKNHSHWQLSGIPCLTNQCNIIFQSFTIYLLVIYNSHHLSYQTWTNLYRRLAMASQECDVGSLVLLCLSCGALYIWNISTQWIVSMHSCQATNIMSPALRLL